MGLEGETRGGVSITSSGPDLQDGVGGGDKGGSRDHELKAGPGRGRGGASASAGPERRSNGMGGLAAIHA
jgi:hypothetical protein